MGSVGLSSVKPFLVSYFRKRTQKGLTVWRSLRVCRIVSGSILTFMGMVSGPGTLVAWLRLIIAFKEIMDDDEDEEDAVGDAVSPPSTAEDGQTRLPMPASPSEQTRPPTSPKPRLV
jgi:hypothetical protein